MDNIEGEPISISGPDHLLTRAGEDMTLWPASYGLRPRKLRVDTIFAEGVETTNRIQSAQLSPLVWATRGSNETDGRGYQRKEGGVGGTSLKIP